MKHASERYVLITYFLYNVHLTFDLLVVEINKLREMAGNGAENSMVFSSVISGLGSIPQLPFVRSFIDAALPLSLRAMEYGHR